MTYRDVQAALKARGYRLGSSGPARDGVDGAWGRLSMAALRAFQADGGLPATGVADAATLASLLPAGAARPPPPWFAEAARHLGLREAAGPADNPAILAWAEEFAGWVRGFYTKDAIPW